VLFLNQRCFLYLGLVDLLGFHYFQSFGLGLLLETSGTSSLQVLFVPDHLPDGLELSLFVHGREGQAEVDSFAVGCGFLNELHALERFCKQVMVSGVLPLGILRMELLDVIQRVLDAVLLGLEAHLLLHQLLGHLLLENCLACIEPLPDPVE